MLFNDLLILCIFKDHYPIDRKHVDWIGVVPLIGCLIIIQPAPCSQMAPDLIIFNLWSSPASSVDKVKKIICDSQTRLQELFHFTNEIRQNETCFLPIPLYTKQVWNWNVHRKQQQLIVNHLWLKKIAYQALVNIFLSVFQSQKGKLGASPMKTERSYTNGNHCQPWQEKINSFMNHSMANINVWEKILWIRNQKEISY